MTTFIKCIKQNKGFSRDLREQIQAEVNTGIAMGQTPEHAINFTVGGRLQNARKERALVAGKIITHHQKLMAKARAAGKETWAPGAKKETERDQWDVPEGMPAKSLYETLRLENSGLDDPVHAGGRNASAMDEIERRGEKSIFKELGWPTDPGSFYFDKYGRVRTLSDIKAGFANLNVKGDEAAAWVVNIWNPLDVKDVRKRLDAIKKHRKRFPKRVKVDIDPSGIPTMEKENKAHQTEIDKQISRLEVVLGFGEKPHDISIAPPEPSMPKKVAQSSDLADWIVKKIEAQKVITWRDLFKQADKSFEGTQGEGVYTPRDAYDAMELGVNRYILRNLRFTKADGSRKTPETIINQLKSIVDFLPTQSKRTLEQEAFQQYSTPPFLSYVANWVANIQTGDTYLEPSAGVGGLAVFARMSNAKDIVVNELSERRLGLLRLLKFDRYFSEDAIQLNNILPDDVKPTVVVMNPPFSSTAGRTKKNMTTYGAKHVEQALKRVEPGGRLVAVVGKGMGPEAPTFRQWWADIAKDHTVRANIRIAGKEYQKYGTTFGNRLIIIDKIGANKYDTIIDRVETVNDLPKILEGIRNDRQEILQPGQEGEPPSIQPPLPGPTPPGEGPAPGPRSPGSKPDDLGTGPRPPGTTPGTKGGTRQDDTGDTEPGDALPGPGQPGPGGQPPGSGQAPTGQPGLPGERGDIGVSTDPNAELTLDELGDLFDEVAAEQAGAPVAKTPLTKPKAKAPGPPAKKSEGSDYGDIADLINAATEVKEPTRKYKATRYTVRKEVYAEARGETGPFHDTWRIYTPEGDRLSKMYTSQAAAENAVKGLSAIEVREKQVPFAEPLMLPEVYEKARPTLLKKYIEFMTGVGANARAWMQDAVRSLAALKVDIKIAKNWILHFYANHRPEVLTRKKEAAKKIAIEKAKQKKREIQDRIYERYRPFVKIKGSIPHPTALDESAALADTFPPPATYRPKLPKKMVTEGLVSDMQLESVVYTGQAHEQILPNGERKGMFIGHGTGAGKGRIVASVILDNWNRGRKKAIWISEKATLFNDAKRDLGYDASRKQASGIQWEEGTESLFDLTSAPYKKNKKFPDQDGILFTTYDTLRNNYSDINQNEPASLNDLSIRINQIVDWAGPDYDGVIAFDESHNMANATTTQGERGRKQAAQKALAGMMLQTRLPKARVLYVSATGATEVRNLAYAQRLGLWGEGTAFSNQRAFITSIEGSGIADMELVARDMKSQGIYLAPTLSYDGVVYDRLEHPLDDRQRAKYDELAGAWQIVLRNVNAAMGETGQDHDGRKKAGLMSAFWGGHQRFFNQLVTTMSVGTVIDHMEKQIEQDNAIVIQLVNHGGAQFERTWAAREEGQEIEDLDFSPKASLLEYVENSFPVQQYEPYTDANGNEGSRPVFDSEGNPVLNREAVAMREALLTRLASIDIPGSPLDVIIEHFGHEMVAEVTGRKHRVVIDPETGEKIVESRSNASADADAEAFMDDEKRILIFSEKGGTGRSYHADLDRANQRKRIHYLLQPGWRADKAIQGMGRSHRSNQAQPPEYFLITTDLKAQKRFISSIARRLDQLGALTKGQRQTGSQGIFIARDNLESDYARSAVLQLYDDIIGGRSGVSINEFEEQTNLKLVNEDGDPLASLPGVTQFMNRLLSMRIEPQGKLFDEWADRIDSLIDAAAASGTLDIGIETITGLLIEKAEDRIVHTGESTGAKTRYVRAEITEPSRRLAFEDIVNADKFFVNTSSGKVWMASPRRTGTDQSGNTYGYRTLTSPAKTRQRINTDILEDPKRWGEQTDEKEVARLWEAAYSEISEHATRDIHLMTGSLLPIWDRLPGSSTVYRMQTDDGERLLGRVIHARKIEQVLRDLGITTDKKQYTGAELSKEIVDQNSKVRLVNNWNMKRSLVSGEERIELRGPDFDDLNTLQKYGVIVERIANKTRYFIPTGKNSGAVIDSIIKYKPVADVQQVYQGPTLQDTVIGQPSDINKLFGKAKQTQLSLFGGNQQNLFTDKKSEGAPKKKAPKQYPPREAVTLERTGDISHYGTKVKNDAEVAGLVSFLLNKAAEEAYTVATDKDNNVVQIHKISKGGKSSASVPLIETGGTILRDPDIKKVYFVHQHPSGDPEPSPEDWAVSRNIARIAQLRGIETRAIVMAPGKGIGTGEPIYVSFDPIKGQGALKLENRSLTPEIRKRVKSNLNTKLVIKERFVKTVRGYYGKEQAETVNTSVRARAIIETRYNNEAGGLFLDAKLQDVGFMSWSENEPIKEYAARIISEADRHNASVMLFNLKTKDKSGELSKQQAMFFKNFMGLFQNYGLSVVEVLVDGKSLRDTGRLQLMEPPGNSALPDSLANIIKEDILFSRKVSKPDVGMTVKSVQNVVDPILNEMAVKPPVTVLAKQSTLPEGIRTYLRDNDATNDIIVAAIHDGRVYLVAENIENRAEAIRALLHEVMGHFGIRAVLGDQVNKTLQSVYIAKRPEIDLIALEYGFDLKTKEGRLAAADEWLARQAQTNPDSGWIDKLVAIIRKWLRKIDSKLKFSDTEIRALLKSARQYLRTGQKSSVFPPISFDRKPELADQWYSQMENYIGANLPDRGTAASYLQMVNGMAKSGRIKKEELEWSGLRDWLKDQKGKVEKADVMKYIRANNIKLKEIVKTQSPAAARDIEWDQMGPDGIEGSYEHPHTGEFIYITIKKTETGEFALTMADQDYGTFAYPGDAQESAKDEVDQMLSRWDDFGYQPGSKEGYMVTKHDQWQEPGGKEYKELLIMLPPYRFNQKTQDRIDELNKKTNDYEATPEEQTELNRLLEKRDQAEFMPPAAHHAGEPNILVHFRFNERIDTNGDRVLFLEEIQSDWHQKGRKKGYEGYGGLPPNVKTKQLSTGRWTIEEEERMFADWAAADTEQEAIRKYLSGGERVPNAPFKKSSRMLAFKRAVRWAAENDFDRIAWTTGEMQVDRYDLSRYLDRIEHEPAYDDSGKTITGYDFRAYGKDGSEVINETNINLERVEELAGKEVAEKIKNREGEKGDSGYRDWLVLSGLDLKVGGEGLRKIYDKILPSEVKAFFGKKVWGSPKIEASEIDKAATQHIRELDKEAVTAEVLKEASSLALSEGESLLAETLGDQAAQVANGEPVGFSYLNTGYSVGSYVGRVLVSKVSEWIVLDVNGVPDRWMNDELVVFETQGQAENHLWETMNGHGDVIDKSKLETKRTVMSLPITPEMKAKALYEGMPMFMKKQGALDVVSRLPENVRDRFAQARGLPKQSWIEKAKERIGYVAAQRHHFPDLYEIHDPKQEDQLSDILRQHQEVPESAKHQAVQNILKFTRPLSQDEYEIFRIHVILADMMRDIEEGVLSDVTLQEGDTMPFGFQNVEAIKKAFDEFDQLADQVPSVRKAITDRRSEINRLTRDMVKYKVLKKEVLKHKDYFHHQVLTYWAGNQMKTAGTSSKDVRKHWRPWMVARKGSMLDYNTEYVEAEFAAMAQQIAQIDTAKNLEKIKNVSDIFRDLKTAAKFENFKRFYQQEAARLSRIFKQKITPAEVQEDSELDPLFSYRQNIAMASSNLAKMAYDNKLEVDSEWDDVLDAMAEEHELKKMGIDEGSLGLSERSQIPDGRYFSFLAYLIDKKKPGAMWAATTFKAIAGRNKAIKGGLGENFVTFRQIMPEGYTVWKPEPNKGWFWANTITDDILQKVIEGEKALGDQDVKQMLAKGQDLMWVIPEGLASTLDDFRRYPESNSIGQAADWALRAWKQWVLINPRRWLKYNINNFSGDLDITMAYAPGIASPKALKKALTDLMKWHKHKELDPATQAEIDNARHKGVIGSGFAVQEVEDVLNIMSMDKWVREVLLGEKPNIARRYWEKAKGSTVLRENMLRLSAYRWFRQALKEGKRVYGASKPHEIDNIPDLDDKAAKLSRELVGDYGNISAAGQYIRKRLLPFYSWMEINAPRYVYLMRNLRSEDRFSDAADVRRRMAGIMVKKVAVGGVKLAIKAQMLMAAVLLWNLLAHRDEWEELGEARRRQLHLILGRREDGTIQTIRFQGALSDALSWFGLEDWPADVQDVLKGRNTIQDKLVEVPKAIATKGINAIRPEPKLLFEGLTGETLYPDPFRPRPIRDTLGHVLRTFSLDSLYRQASGKPGRGNSVAKHMLADLKSIIIYDSDPGEQAYYDTRHSVFEWLENQGIERPSGRPTKRSNALYYYRQALKYGDFKAAKRYLGKYYDLGGTGRTLLQGVKRAHPLASIPMRKRYSFRETLNGKQQERLRIALEWYQNTYRGQDQDIRAEVAKERYGAK